MASKTKPRRTAKPKRSETWICVESFAGNNVNVAAGTRLRGNHEIVKQYGHYFEREVPGEDVAGLLAARQAERASAPPDVRDELPPEPEPPPAKGKVRLKVYGDSNHGWIRLGTSAGPALSGKQFFGGQTFDLEAERAEAVLREIGAWVEVVEPGDAES